MHKVVAPELEGRIFDELDEGNEKTPGVGPVHNQPLQQNPERPSSSCSSLTANVCVWLKQLRGSPGDLLLDGLCVGLSKQVEHGAAEVMGVAVGVAQLVGNGIQEEVSPWRQGHEEAAQSPNTHTRTDPSQSSSLLTFKTNTSHTWAAQKPACLTLRGCFLKEEAVCSTHLTSTGADLPTPPSLSDRDLCSFQSTQ